MTRLLQILFACIALLSRVLGMEPPSRHYDRALLPGYVKRLLSAVPYLEGPQLSNDMIFWAQKDTPVSIDTCITEIVTLKMSLQIYANSFQDEARDSAEYWAIDVKESRIRAFFCYRFAIFHLERFLLSIYDVFPSIVDLLHVFVLVMSHFLFELTNFFAELKSHKLYVALQKTFNAALASRSADIFSLCRTALDAFTEGVFPGLVGRHADLMSMLVIPSTFLNLLFSLAKLFSTPILSVSNNDAFRFTIPARLARQMNHIFRLNQCPDLEALAESFLEDLDIFLTGSPEQMRSYASLEFFLHDEASKELNMYRVSCLWGCKNGNQFRFMDKMPYIPPVLEQWKDCPAFAGCDLNYIMGLIMAKGQPGTNPLKLLGGSS